MVRQEIEEGKEVEEAKEAEEGKDIAAGVWGAAVLRPHSRCFVGWPSPRLTPKKKALQAPQFTWSSART